MTKKYSNDDAAALLKELDRSIRKHHPGNPVNRRVGFNELLRNVNESEWENLVRIIAMHEFPCEIMSGPYGFAFCVYYHGPIQGEKPEFLLAIEDSQFPFPSASNGFNGQEETLGRLKLIIHSPRNRELLRWYGFEAPREDIELYAY